ncbi:MAG TPA: cytochrome c oxidase subunit II [Bryobacteraceae bacterium]|nr:cytochrome c oxidase subunit II [Bryobacteraceae bacterium]
MQISVFNPASPQAGHLLWLWNACMWVCGFILTVVTLAIVYILVRYRRRDDHEPSQTTGNTKLEITWTVVPIILITFLFVVSIVTARAVDQPIHRPPDIVVRGHQWWWEVQYPSAKAITANEIHIPVGQEMLIGIEAADVIHDFWVPRLARKVDAIPGQRNFVWIHADRPGNYSGACAEYCGAQHAWMRFRVLAEDRASYEAWLAAQAAPAIEPAGGDAKSGEKLFRQFTCANCHNIRGIHSQEQYGPDLTHIASRKMLAAERLENTPENLKDWLHEPNLVKPNCYMPNLNLAESDLTQLTAFMESLK